jgi:hypothetical protein
MYSCGISALILCVCEILQNKTKKQRKIKNNLRQAEVTVMSVWRAGGGGGRAVRRPPGLGHADLVLQFLYCRGGPSFYSRAEHGCFYVTSGFTASRGNCYITTNYLHRINKFER